MKLRDLLKEHRVNIEKLLDQEVGLRAQNGRVYINAHITSGPIAGLSNLEVEIHVQDY